MSQTRPVPADHSTPDLHRGVAARITQILVMMAAQAALLFLGAGRLRWTWAWVYLGICVASLLTNATLLLTRNPELVAERGRATPMRGWDAALGGLWALMLFVVVPLASGLDARFGWTGPLAPQWHVAGAGLLAGAFVLSGWAMIANAYFSTVVRIQAERGHSVCRSGPYRFVRHPGYVGFIVQALATPVLLGSRWALVAGLAGAAAMAARTAFEDRALRAELTGYAEYAREVRYCLLPGVW